MTSTIRLGFTRFVVFGTMRSHRAFQSLSSFLISSSHTVGCPFASSTTASLSLIGARHASNGSSKRWLDRQSRDSAKKAADLKGLRSRASIKLLEIHAEYKIFKANQTVVDLGYAPGSWSQVAVDKTMPQGRVIGVDVIPALPPKGVSTIQGNFRSLLIQEGIKRFLSNPDRGRPRKPIILRSGEATEKDAEEAGQGYIERERHMTQEEQRVDISDPEIGKDSVDVVLSDMSEPWVIVEGLWKGSLSIPYRLMNTSGIPFRDHAGSMDLCTEALLFCIDVLKPGGSFVCKFYQGSEDILMEKKIQMVFRRVSRNKPKSSRPESRENYFIALDKKEVVDKSAVMAMGP